MISLVIQGDQVDIMSADTLSRRTHIDNSNHYIDPS